MAAMMNFTQKSAAAWRVNTKHLHGAYAAMSSSSWSIVHLYLLLLQQYYTMTYSMSVKH